MNPEKRCFNCHKPIILSKEKFVVISTYETEKYSIEEAYFHFQCWANYFDQKVYEKARKSIKQIQERALSIFSTPKIQEMLQNIEGTEMAMNMLKMPLKEPEEIIDVTEKLVKKTENDAIKRLYKTYDERKRRRGKEKQNKK